MSATSSRRSFLRLSAVSGVSALVGAGALIGTQSLIGADGAAPQTETDADHTSTVSGTVVSADGVQLVASIEVFDSDGERSVRVQSDLVGRFEISLPLGEWTLVVSRGYEYARQAIDVSLVDRLRQELGPITLERHIDLSTAGWFAGDLHQHTSYSDGYQGVGTVMLSAVANGMSWGALTDHNTVAGVAEWLHSERVFAAEPMRYLPLPGCEITTERGHFNLIGARVLIDHETPGGAVDVNRIIAEAKASGGLLQLNHPHLASPMGFADWELLKQFDLLEVWNGKGQPNASTNAATKLTWYELLSQGVFIPATSGSDNHDVTGGYLWARDGDEWMNRGLYSGSPAVYVQTGAAPSAESVLAALKQGRSFITNGPLPRFTVSGRGPGSTVAAGVQTVQVAATDVRGLDRVDIVINGEVRHERTFSGELDGELSFEFTGKPGDWCLVEAFGADGGYALSNPVFIGTTSSE